MVVTQNFTSTYNKVSKNVNLDVIHKEVLKNLTNNSQSTITHMTMYT